MYSTRLSYVPAKHPTREESILAAAQQAAGYHILFVHADADADNTEQAYMRRIEPGLSMVQSAHTNGISVCRHLIAVIPVQMVEAWLLADAEALSETVGISAAVAMRLMPSTPHEIERLSDPKSRLLEIIRYAQAQRPRRRRSVALGEYYEPMANRIGLQALQRLPSYQYLEQELQDVLQQLGFTSR